MSSLKCSFCGKDPLEVEKLVSGEGVSICSTCIELSNEAIEESRLEAAISSLMTSEELAEEILSAILSNPTDKVVFKKLIKDALCIAISRSRRDIISLLKPYLKSFDENTVLKLLDKGRY